MPNRSFQSSHSKRDLVATQLNSSTICRTLYTATAMAQPDSESRHGKILSPPFLQVRWYPPGLAGVRCGVNYVEVEENNACSIPVPCALLSNCDKMENKINKLIKRPKNAVVVNCTLYTVFSA